MSSLGPCHRHTAAARACATEGLPIPGRTRHTVTVTTARSELGELLRSWRDRLAPHAVGIDPTATRRTTGLRREEVALAAGVSVDYLVRLEQGRSTHPSAQVVDALARALHLDSAERALLHRTAGLLPPAEQSVQTALPFEVVRLAARLDDHPVAVFDATWQLRTWNSMWSALHGDPESVPTEQRNMVRAVFGSDDRARSWMRPVSMADGLERFATALVADLRIAVGRYPDDRVLRRLVDDMRCENAYFDTLWSSGVAAVHVGDRKTIVHPEVGEITLDCDVLTAPGADLRLVVYSAEAGTADADALSRLRAARVDER
ncbi:XRE family transcriptional regulator [Rhodococcus sp. 05-339-2]|nr:XRE family transcriptional regulator [Rhodococcus sp. 05-339-2]